jgi:hypothetical protein
MKYKEGVGYGEIIRDYHEKQYGPGRRLRRAFVATLVILTLYVYVGIQIAHGAGAFVPH